MAAFDTTLYSIPVSANKLPAALAASVNVCRAMPTCNVQFPRLEQGGSCHVEVTRLATLWTVTLWKEEIMPNCVSQRSPEKQNQYV